MSVRSSTASGHHRMSVVASAQVAPGFVGHELARQGPAQVNARCRIAHAKRHAPRAHPWLQTTRLRSREYALRLHRDEHPTQTRHGAERVRPRRELPYGKCRPGPKHLVRPWAAFAGYMVRATAAACPCVRPTAAKATETAAEVEAETATATETTTTRAMLARELCARRYM